MISVFDLFKIGIGPSSSHTVGPMRAARLFAQSLQGDGVLEQTDRVRVVLYGSLALTGRGHATDKAVLLGLLGEEPESVFPDAVDAQVAEIREKHAIYLLGQKPIHFDEADDLIFEQRETLPYHINGMRFSAWDAAGELLATRDYYSVGGGFVVSGDEVGTLDDVGEDDARFPYPFTTATELLHICEQEQIPIYQVVLRNENAIRPEEETRAGILRIWAVMQDCVTRGCAQTGLLPGGLRVERRAPKLYHSLTNRPEHALRDPLTTMDWVNLYALAVNEENAAGGRVVTAPTNGAAGIIPAVLHYYTNFSPDSSEEGVVRFFLTAAAIGMLYKANASISGAEVGCQGEVGVACSMAAGGLAEVRGGSIYQVENAAEIGMEHNLGLTCDPVSGLVQIPCIERNAMGAIKAINATRIALRGDGAHHVSLDNVIATMRQTGEDMNSRYKETSLGGLAVNLVEC